MKGNNQPPDKKDGSKPAESNVDVFNILNSMLKPVFCFF
jgi:hypothetical protein